MTQTYTQWGKAQDRNSLESSVAERARPRERSHAKTGTVLTVCFVERHTTKPGARNADTVKD